MKFGEEKNLFSLPGIDPWIVPTVAESLQWLSYIDTNHRMFFVSFQNITVKIAVACSVTPYSLVEINQSFKETCFLYLKYSTIAATLNMEATGSPETLVNLYTTI